MGRQLWTRLSAPLHNDRGAVLVITIFVVALVTILVLEYHYDAAVEIELAENHANDAKAYQLAMAGLNFAQAILANDTNEYDGPNELWHNLESFGCIAPNDFLTIAKAYIESLVKPGEDEPEEPPVSESSAPACVALKIVDEDRKLPINHILDNQGQETHWAGIAVLLLRSLWEDEEGRDLPEDAIGAVMDWMDQSEGSTRPGGVGGEDDYYQTLDPPYKTPGRKLEVPGELRLIRHFVNQDAPEEERYNRLASLFGSEVEAAQIPNMDLGTNLYFSTFDHDRININTAFRSPSDSESIADDGERLTEENQLLSAIINNEACLDEIAAGNASDDQLQLLAERFKTEEDVQNLGCLQDKLNDLDLPTVQTRLGSVNPAADDDAEEEQLSSLFSVSSTYFRVESQAVIDGQIHKKVVAVFERDAPRPSGGGNNNQTGNRQTGNRGGNQNQADQQSRLNMVYFKIE